jgi:hypothetical protein
MESTRITERQAAAIVSAELPVHDSRLNALSWRMRA